MGRKPPLTRLHLFQSSPAPKDGRYTPKALAKAHISVSILARPEGRALPGSGEGAGLTRLFQSSPAPKDGRYPDAEPEPPLAAVFQSSPAPKDGRYATLPIVPSSMFTFQSSPAPKDGRYKHEAESSCTHYRFNPRPPRRTGATIGDELKLIGGVVSILARPEGRALHESRIRSTSCGRFNPRPPRRTGATMRTPSREHVLDVSILARPEGRALPLTC